MKKLAKLAPLCGAVLAVVAFILVMATPALTMDAFGGKIEIAGTSAIFGETTTLLGKTIQVYNPSWAALIGWILLIVAFVVLVLSTCGELLGVKALKGLNKLFNIIGACSLIVAAILLALVVPTFMGANDMSGEGMGIGAGWVIAVILSGLGGLGALLPVLSK